MTRPLAEGDPAPYMERRRHAMDARRRPDAEPPDLEPTRLSTMPRSADAMQAPVLSQAARLSVAPMMDWTDVEIMFSLNKPL